MSHCALSPSPDSAEGPWAPKGRDHWVLKRKELEKVYCVPLKTLRVHTDHLIPPGIGVYPSRASE